MKKIFFIILKIPHVQVWNYFSAIAVLFAGILQLAASPLC
jgi:hypothetical protein